MNEHRYRCIGCGAEFPRRRQRDDHERECAEAGRVSAEVAADAETLPGMD